MNSVTAYDCRDYETPIIANSAATLIDAGEQVLNLPELKNKFASPFVESAYNELFGALFA